MVFVPLAIPVARALRAAPSARAVTGFAATPALTTTLGTPCTPEEAEFAALSTAGVAALDGLVGPRRLVLAAEVEPDRVEDPGGALGQVALTGVVWAQVRALFADEEAAAASVLAAAGAVGGLALEEALVAPEVVQLLEAVDLLWYAPEELDDLG